MSARKLTQVEALVLADYYRRRALQLAKASSAFSPDASEYRQARAMEAHCNALHREWLDHVETLTEESV